MTQSTTYETDKYVAEGDRYFDTNIGKQLCKLADPFTYLMENKAMTRKELEAIYPEQSQDPSDFKPKGISYLQLKVEDAMYNPILSQLQHHLFSEDAGMGLVKPDSQFVTYQRLWEYYAYQDILREAIAKDIAVTGMYPTIEASYSGVGFEDH